MTNVKVIICADVATHNCKNDVDSAFSRVLLRDIKPTLDTADFRLANLECVLCDSSIGAPITKSGPNLLGDPKNFAFFKEAGIDCAILANNHFGDYGPDAARATIGLIEENGIDYVGGGENIEEAYKAWYAEKNGLKVAFIAVCENEFGGATESTCGSAVFSMKKLRDRVIEEKAVADFVVVLFHGGHEHNPIPAPETIDRYRLIVDIGADAVIAGHTHCMQGFEIYEGHPIVYSMGNFFFFKTPNMLNSEEAMRSWNHGYMTELTFTKGEKIALKVIPYELRDNGRWLHLLDGEEKERILSYLDRLSSVISDPSLTQRYFDAWCTLSGIAYSGHVSHLPEFTEPQMNKQLAAKQAALRNIFFCEAHDALMRGLLRLEYEGRMEEARAFLPELEKLRIIPR